MDIQRLRNLTTGRLHTKMGDIYEDLEFISGNEGVMTHMIPRVMRAVEPWLRRQVPDERFWDGEYDTTHVGEFAIEPMSDEEQKAMFARYAEMPNPLDGKEVIAVQLDLADMFDSTLLDFDVLKRELGPPNLKHGWVFDEVMVAIDELGNVSVESQKRRPSSKSYAKTLGDLRCLLVVILGAPPQQKASSEMFKNYRKKPIVIKAAQWWPPGDERHDPTMLVNRKGNSVDPPDYRQVGDLYCFYDAELIRQGGESVYMIRTLEGDMKVSPGDWVIIGVNGEKYACKPDIFEKTYDPVSMFEAAERSCLRASRRSAPYRYSNDGYVFVYGAAPEAAAAAESEAT